MDRLQAMTTFVAVVDSGGFASAARKLNQSPPVVTRAVAELEERLGLRLLTRTTRVVRVTDAGARFAEDCRRILADIEEAETAATGAHVAPRGTLLITAPVLFGQLYVTPILVSYLQQFPEVDVQCLFLDRVVNVVEEGIDVAVRIGELPDSSLRVIRVGRVRRVLVAAPPYLQARDLPQRRVAAGAARLRDRAAAGARGAPRRAARDAEGACLHRHGGGTDAGRPGTELKPGVIEGHAVAGQLRSITTLPKWPADFRCAKAAGVSSKAKVLSTTGWMRCVDRN